TDGIAGAERTGIDLNGHFTLFYAGPLEVFVESKLDVNVGVTEIDDTRLLSGVPAGWPQQSRKDNAVVGPTALGSWCLFDCDPTHFYTAQGGYGVGIVDNSAHDGAWTQVFPWPFSQPMLARAIQDDDHTVARTTGAELTLTLGAQAGRTFGPITIA